MILLLQRPVAIWALVIGGAASSACTSVGVGAVEMRGPGAGGVVEVRVFDTPRARRANTVSARRILCELWRGQAGAGELVSESAEPRWIATDLPPGTYAVRAARSVDADGTVHRLPSKDTATFAVAPGELVRVDVVLHHPRRVLVGSAIGFGAVAVATTVGLIIVLGAMSGW